VDPAQGQLIGDPLRAPSGLSQRLGDDPALDLGVERGRPTRPPATMLGVKPVSAVLPVSIPKLVVKRAGDACLSAGFTDVAELFRSAEEPKALKVYLLFEGHCAPSLVAVW